MQGRHVRGEGIMGMGEVLQNKGTAATRSVHVSDSFHTSESVQLRAVETKVKMYGMHDGLMIVDRPGEISDRQRGAQGHE